jgi:hypothetical protein
MDTFEGMLVAQPSEETRSLLGESKSNRETAR